MECLFFAAVYPKGKSGWKKRGLESILQVPCPAPGLADSGRPPGCPSPWDLALHVLPHNYTLLRDRSDGSLSCRNCGKTFSITSNMLRHRRQCEGRGHLMCGYCGQQFARRDKYSRHLALKHGEEGLARAHFAESEPGERDVSGRSPFAVEAGDIEAGDIEAGDVSQGDVSQGDVSQAVTTASSPRSDAPSPRSPPPE